MSLGPLISYLWPARQQSFLLLCSQFHPRVRSCMPWHQHRPFQRMETDARLALKCSSLNDTIMRAWMTTINVAIPRRRKPINSTIQDLDGNEEVVEPTHRTTPVWALRENTVLEAQCGRSTNEQTDLAPSLSNWHCHTNWQRCDITVRTFWKWHHCRTKWCLSLTSSRWLTRQTTTIACEELQSNALSESRIFRC